MTYFNIPGYQFNQQTGQYQAAPVFPGMNIGGNQGPNIGGNQPNLGITQDPLNITGSGPPTDGPGRNSYPVPDPRNKWNIGGNQGPNIGGNQGPHLGTGTSVRNGGVSPGYQGALQGAQQNYGNDAKLKQMPFPVDEAAVNQRRAQFNPQGWMTNLGQEFGRGGGKGMGPMPVQTGGKNGPIYENPNQQPGGWGAGTNNPFGPGGPMSGMDPFNRESRGIGGGGKGGGKS